MSPPTWLPPLNTHENYSVRISASQTHSSLDDQSLPSRQFSIGLRVNFYSQDTSMERSFPGLSINKIVHVPCNSTTFKHEKPTTLLKEIVGNMISDVQFELTRVHWEEKQHDGYLSRTLLEDENDVIRNILGFLTSMRTAPCNLNRKILYLDLVIKKIVIIPSHESEVWISWYHEQNRLNIDFVSYFEWAISRPRSLRALMNEAALASKSKPATRSLVEALEEVKLVSSNVTTELCTICQEQLLVGTNVRRMPCSHMFHKECIMKWLKGSHICPLCRFMLPTD